jgi:hypothetical protein
MLSVSIISFNTNLKKMLTRKFMKNICVACIEKITNLFVLCGIRRNCHSSERNLLLYQFIERVIRLTVIIIEESLSYPTFFCPG